MNGFREANRDMADARWISNQDPHMGSARVNQYICFRKEFNWGEIPEEALLHITADYRYTVWINGSWVGQGPIRGWPHQRFYDTYDVTSLLRIGSNAIAVLLNVLAVSTFQYIPSDNPGFALRLCGDASHGETGIVTDSSWLCLAHPSLEDNTPRISTQQAFVEHFDSRRDPVGWKLAGFRYNLTDDGISQRWFQASVADVQPSLVPRDIPQLTEDEMYPIRIRGLSRVRPPMSIWSIDLSALLLPDMRDSNPHFVCGMVTTTVSLVQAAHIRFHFQDRTSGLSSKLSVNGQPAKPIEDSGSHWSGLYHYDVDLPAGESLLVFWFEGVAHEFTFQVAIEAIVQATTIGYRVEAVPKAEEYMIQLEPSLPGLTGGRFAFYALAENEQERFGALKQAANWKVWQVTAADRSVMIPRLSEHTDNVFLRMRHAEVVTDPHYGFSVDIDHYCCSGNSDYTVIPSPRVGEAVQLVLEFEKMTSGLIEFEIFAQSGAILDFYGFEAYRGEEPVHMDSMHNTMRYVCRQGWQSYRSSMQRSFRYLMVQLSGFQGDIKLRHVKCLLRTYPSPSIGSFRCNDEKLNRIYEISRWTARLCSDDVFVDCPTYEQAFWVGDAYVMSGIQSTLAGAEPLVQRCLLLAAESLSRSPVVESQVPSGWENILSTWSLLWALACTDHVRRSGDLIFAERIYPSLRKQALYIHEHLTDEKTGLIRSPYWNLLDWAAIDAPSPAIVAHVNAWYAKSCRQTAELAILLRHESDAETFFRIAGSVTEGINVHLWDTRRQAFADCLRENGELSATASEQTQLVCFVSDVAWPERRNALLPYIRGEVMDTVRTATPFMRYFKLQALEKAGLIDALLQEIRSIWGYMLEEDSTTCWEDMPGRWAPGYPTRSYCHGWSVAPAYFLPHTILGIGEIDQSAASILISPQPSDLQWVSGGVMTQKGEINIRWESSQREFSAIIQLPKGLNGWVKLPMEAHLIGKIKVNDQVAMGANVEKGHWLIPVADGTTSKISATVRSWS